MGKPMYVAMISNAQNIANLDKLKKINKQLALNPDLTTAQRTQMIKDGKVFIYATLSIHSSKVGPTQASPLIAYELITTKDPQIRSWLDKTVFALLEKKVTVYRTKAGFKTSAGKIPAGSFVVKNGSSVKEIVKNMDVSPITLESKPEVALQKTKMPRIALMVSWFHDMDAGWTRYIFDTYHIPYTQIHPGDVATLDFSKFDILIFPDMSKSVLMDGKYSESGYSQPNLPPEYTKGIGEKGLQKIMAFVNNGGKILSWGRSTNLFEGTLTIQGANGQKEAFVLPYRNIAPGMQKKGLYCPGTFIKVNWKRGNPLTFGMEKQTGIFYRGNPVFKTWQPGFDMDRRVIGWFPETHLVLSGDAENINMVGNKAIMVRLRKGKGHLILYGFSPIFRASTPVTYKLVFNGILM